MTHLPSDVSGHRARLRQRLFDGGGRALLDHELVEYLIALAITRAAQYGYQRFGLNFVISPSLEWSMLGITLLMCLAASVLSARRAFRIDPAMVFRS